MKKLIFFFLLSASGCAQTALAKHIQITPTALKIRVVQITYHKIK